MKRLFMLILLVCAGNVFGAASSSSAAASPSNVGSSSSSARFTPLGSTSTIGTSEFALQDVEMEKVRESIVAGEIAIVEPRLQGKFVVNACELGKLDDVRMFYKELFKLNGTRHLRMPYGGSPAGVACRNGHLELAKFFVEELGVSVSGTLGTPVDLLSEACRGNKIKVVKYLIETAKADVNAKPVGYRETPLAEACSYGADVELVKYLIEEAGAQIECRPGIFAFLHSSLDSACRGGNLEVVRYLIEEVRVPYKNILSHLCKTTMKIGSRSIGIFRYLVEKGKFDVGCVNKLLHEACLEGFLPGVKYLIEECEANVSVCNGDGQTLLTVACQKGFVPIVKYLIEEVGIDVNEPCCRGRRPVFEACEYKRLELLKYLIEHAHADIDVRDDRHVAPLELACFAGHLKIVKYLVETAGLNINAVQVEVSPFVGACGARSVGLPRGIYSALHIACKYGYLPMVKYLVEDLHIDIDSRCDNGETPLSIARFHKSQKVVEYLMEQGATHEILPALVSQDDYMLAQQRHAQAATCAICLDALERPQTTSCCKNAVYCAGCITRAMEEKPTCPTCRKALRVEMLIDIEVSAEADGDEQAAGAPRRPECGGCLLL